MVKWQDSERRLQKSVLVAGQPGEEGSGRQRSSLLPIFPQAGMLQAPQKDLCKPKLVIVNVNKARADYPSQKLTHLWHLIQ